MARLLNIFVLCCVGVKLMSCASIATTSGDVSSHVDDCRAACAQKFAKTSAKTAAVPGNRWKTTLVRHQNTLPQRQSDNDYQSVLPKSASGKIRKATVNDQPDGLMECWNSCEIVTTTQPVETQETTTTFADSEISFETEIVEVQSESGTEVYGGAVETTTQLAVEIDVATDKAVVDMPLELKLVSLIHQQSLVIAEIKWIEEGLFPGKQYLVTWELTGGGLKGHLVTDTNSVTLSLWPSTSYKVQVEPFKLNLDSDGEQPMPTTESDESSAPLIVDTSVASFSLEHPYALLVSEYTITDGQEYEGEQEQEHEPVIPEAAEKRDQSDDVFFISLLSIILMITLITLAAVSWPRLRTVTSLESKGKDVTLLIPSTGASLEKEYSSVSVISFTDSCSDTEKCRHCVQIA